MRTRTFVEATLALREEAERVAVLHAGVLRQFGVDAVERLESGSLVLQKADEMAVPTRQCMPDWMCLGCNTKVEIGTQPIICCRA